MIVFTLARARPVPGRQIRPGRAGADPGLRRRVRLHERVGRRPGQPPVGRRVAVAPVALAVVVDRTVAVIRRHILADQEPWAWITLGRVAAAAARITGLVLLYCLRFAWRPADGPGPAPDGAGRRPAARAPRGGRAGGDRAAPHQEGRPARLVPRPPGPREPRHSQPGRRRTGPAGGAEAGPPAATCTPSWTAGHLTADPPAEPSRRALARPRAWPPWPHSSLTFTARSTPSTNGSTRPGSAPTSTSPPGSRTWPRPSPTRSTPPPPADPPHRTGSAWTATPTPPGWPTCGGGPTPCCASTRRLELRDCWPRHIHAIWELSTLAAEWHRIYSGKHPTWRGHWSIYDRWLPNTMRRVTDITRTCVAQCTMLRRPW